MSIGHPNPTAAGVGRRETIALACLVVTLASLSALLYAVPPGMVGAMGLAPEGASRFKDALPFARAIAPVSGTTFVWFFRTLVVGAWMAWVVLVTRAYSGHVLTPKTVSLVAAAVAVALALFCPPVLSRDVFAYVAYARLPFLHGLNPYLNDRAALEMVGDPAATFLVWSSPLPYGPLWTMMATALASAGHAGGLYAEVVAHKLVAAAALLATARGAAVLADLRAPGRGAVTYAAIALNPLLLIEGPGTGHNDLVMVALLVWAAVMSATARWRTSAVGVGLAMATKPVALVALPALVLNGWACGSGWPRARRVMWIAGLAVSVPILLSLPFGGPFVVAASVIQQGGVPLGGAGRLVGSAMAIAAAIWAWRFITHQASTWPAAWLTAWIPLSVVLVLVGTRQWFPWYVSWALVPALCGWDERHRILTAGTCAFGLLLMWCYTYRP